MRRCMIVALFFLSILVPAHMSAWGCVGHQVVAYIALQNLNSTAAAHVTDLLSDAQYGDLKRFCASTNLGKIEYFATWADDARTDANAGWHFWDIPLAADTASLPQFCDEGCVVTALTQQVAILNSKDAARRDRQQALMFVIHLVGDAHQPMHIVDNGDRGGNCVPVSFEFAGFAHKTEEAKGKNGQPTGSYSPNLHSIWDDNVIQTMTGIEKKTDSDQLTKAFADSIAREFAEQIKANGSPSVDLSGSDFTSWALAAHKLAGPNSYGKMSTDIPVNPHPQTLKSCAGVSNGFARLNETVQGDFVKNAQTIVRQQLALAGARLAATLNTIWPSQ